MAFQTQTANRQSNVAKSYTPIKRDMLMLVTGYDIEKHVVFGELMDGRKTEVSIDGEAFARGIKAERDAPYQKHRIDAKMQAKIPANGKTYAVLENAEVLRKGKNEVRVIRANRVHLAGSNKAKAFESLLTFTMNHKMKRVDRVQSWSGSAFVFGDAEKEGDLLKRLDSAFELHEAEEAKLAEKKSSFWIPYVGFELRTIAVPNNPTEPLRVVDMSGRFETNTIDAVVNGESVKFRTQINAENYKVIAQQYADYAKQTYGEDTRVEVTWYNSYPVSQYSRELDFSAVEEGKYNPFVKMATARSRLAVGDNTEVEGGNFGCWGVLRLSPDALNQETGEVKRQYYVSGVFANTRAKNFVQQKIKSADGQLPVFDEGLKSTLMQYTVNQFSQAPAQQYTPVQPPVSVSPSQVKVDLWADDDDIPFAVESGPGIPAATRPVPESKAPRQRPVLVGVETGFEDIKF